MSTDSAKKHEDGWMFPIDRVAAIYWREEDALNLRRIRESREMSLRDLVDKVNTDVGLRCTYSYVHKLETFQTKRTNPLLVEALAQVLGVDLFEVVASSVLIRSATK